MPKRLLHALAVFAVTASPLAAENLSIDHSAVGCVEAGKFPRLQARFVPGDAVAKARVFFTTASAKRWYAVARGSTGRCGGSCAGIRRISSSVNAVRAASAASRWPK